MYILYTKNAHIQQVIGHEEDVDIQLTGAILNLHTKDRISCRSSWPRDRNPLILVKFANPHSLVLISDSAENEI